MHSSNTGVLQCLAFVGNWLYCKCELQGREQNVLSVWVMRELPEGGREQAIKKKHAECVALKTKSVTASYSVLERDVTYNSPPCHHFMSVDYAHFGGRTLLPERVV